MSGSGDVSSVTHYSTAVIGKQAVLWFGDYARPPGEPVQIESGQRQGRGTESDRRLERSGQQIEGKAGQPVVLEATGRKRSRRRDPLCQPTR